MIYTLEAGSAIFSADLQKAQRREDFDIQMKILREADVICSQVVSVCVRERERVCVCVFLYVCWCRMGAESCEKQTRGCV